MKLQALNIILANWEAPKNIVAFSTTRLHGNSSPPYASLNLADHCGDNTNDVYHNRQHLMTDQQLPTEPTWLRQVHGNKAVKINRNSPIYTADASYTTHTNIICAIFTADCLPILLCNREGTEVAAIHAGWRSLANGIVENTIKHFQSDPQDLMAWFGPAISAKAYQVGNEMRNAFLQHDSAAESAFIDDGPKHWLANLTMLARLRLQALQINNISGGDYCTYNQENLFYSYRRDGQTGRMATLIYRT